MLTQTKSASLLLTVIDLASKAINQDDSRECGFPIRDYKTVRILSRRPLPFTAVQNVIARNPEFVCVGIQENDYRNDEF